MSRKRGRRGGRRYVRDKRGRFAHSGSSGFYTAGKVTRRRGGRAAGRPLSTTKVLTVKRRDRSAPRVPGQVGGTHRGRLTTVTTYKNGAQVTKTPYYVHATPNGTVLTRP